MKRYCVNQIIEIILLVRDIVIYAQTIYCSLRFTVNEQIYNACTEILTVYSYTVDQFARFGKYAFSTDKPLQLLGLLIDSNLSIFSPSSTSKTPQNPAAGPTPPGKNSLSCAAGRTSGPPASGPEGNRRKLDIACKCSPRVHSLVSFFLVPNWKP